MVSARSTSLVAAAAAGVGLVIALGGLACTACGQITAVTQERSVFAHVSVSSGAEDGDSAEAPNFAPFLRTLNFSVTGANGAGADATAFQDSAISSTLVTGVLSANCAARTGTTFVTGESDASSSLLFIFNLTNPTSVVFTASGSISLVGANPEGEPSDLDGMISVRLLNGLTEELIAGFTVNHQAGPGAAIFSGELPAGQYVLLARAQMHVFSADLLGPPPRSGSGEAGLQFSFNAVPGPSAAGVLALAALAASRRRR